MNTRRHFLKQSTILSLSPIVPGFLTSTAMAGSAGASGKILVVIQLSGGNDGINTVVPYLDEGYAEHRTELRLPDKDLIKLGDDLAFHPRLRSASELFNDDRLSIVHAVGYPNPNRSHFESMDIWHTAQMKAEDRKAGTGWIGDAVSGSEPGSGPHAMHIGGGTVPVALRGRRCVTTSLSNLVDLQMSLTDLGDVSKAAGSDQSLMNFVNHSVHSAYASAKELTEKTDVDGSPSYPGSELGQRLKIISQVIKSGAASQIYYTSQSGYDTHASQLQTHANLLGTLSSSLKAFMNDMRDSGLQDRILVMAFSEFGRRVAENASAGTDHGTAGPVILAGSRLSQRSYGKLPSLTDLESGDLRHACDFRDLYASILREWLQWQVPATLQPFGMEGLLA